MSEIISEAFQNANFKHAIQTGFFESDGFFDVSIHAWGHHGLQKRLQELNP